MRSALPRSLRGPSLAALVLLAACASEIPPPPPPPSAGSPLQIAGDPPPSEPPPETSIAIDPPAPALDPGVRDGRKIVISPRATRLLLVEIQSLEALSAATPRDSSDAPKLLRRLAEGYVELANAAARDLKVEADPRRAEVSRKRVIAARRAAIKNYTLVRDRYPKFCYYPSSDDKGCIDSAVYYLALELELSGAYDQARKTYFELIVNFPGSMFIPYAYFAFGEMFFEEARRDSPKWVLARQVYEEVLRYGESGVKIAAQGRLDLVCERMGGSVVSPGRCGEGGAGSEKAAE